MIRIVLCIFILTWCNTAQAGITVNQAISCFNNAVDEARSGSTLKSLILRYLAPYNATSRALQFQKSERSWRQLSSAEQRKRTQQLIDFVSDSDRFAEIDLSTVTTNPARAEDKGFAVFLPGHFVRKGEQENFALLIREINGECRLIDVRWSTAWLSKHADIDLD